MRYVILLSWHHGTFHARVYDADRLEEAANVARGANNCVAIEVLESEKDFKTYVDIHDFEYEDDEGKPMSATWQETDYNTRIYPIVRVGKDISRKKFREMME